MVMSAARTGVIAVAISNDPTKAPATSFDIMTAPLICVYRPKT
jgi:hypothetical protein